MSSACPRSAYAPPSSRWAVCLFVALLFSGVSLAHAQPAPDDGSFYGKLGGGLADYTGDVPAWRPTNPFTDPSFVQGSGLPVVVVGELGYQFSPRWALSLGVQAGNYPIEVYPEIEGISDSYRYTPQLLGRYTFAGGTVAPYLDLGVNVTFGGDRPPTSTGVGPSVGGGMNIQLSETASFYLESRFNLTVPDGAVDGAPAGGRFDLTNQLLGFGLKVNFTTPSPPRIRRIEGPTEVQTGTPVTIAAAINEGEADRPLTFRWDFGGGTTKTGRTVTHTFDRPGSHAVSLTVENPAGSVRQSATITAERPPTPAQIAAIHAVPNPVPRGQPVQFRSAARGDGRLRYEWAFGDGTTAAESAPVHTYDTRGQYTAQLRVSNAASTDTRTVTVRVVRAADAGEEAPDSTDTRPEPESTEAENSSADRAEPGWWIVVASMDKAGGAATVAQRYRDQFAAPLSVQVVPTEAEGGAPRHRVVVGPFEGTDAAQQALAEYERQLPAGAWILQLEAPVPPSP